MRGGLTMAAFYFKTGIHILRPYHDQIFSLLLICSRSHLCEPHTVQQNDSISLQAGKLQQQWKAFGFVVNAE